MRRGDWQINQDHLESLEGDARRDFIDAIGGANTAPRKHWREQLDRGEAQGFYLQGRGEVQSVIPIPDTRQIRTVVGGTTGLPTTEYDADFIIDATGLEANIEDHRVVMDLLRHVGAGKNVKGRLDVERDFRVRNADNGEGRIFASGSMTLGGYYAGVDSFLGLQYAALRIHDNLVDAGFGQRIGPGRSTSQWWKWARNTGI